MRTVVLMLVGLYLSLSSFAQAPRDEFYMWPTDSEGRFVFTEAIYIADASADKLFTAAKAFVTRTFTSEKDSISFNEATKSIDGKGAYFIPVEQLGERGKGFVSFKFSIKCIDRSYKYTISDFEHFPLNPNCVYGGRLENDKAACGGMLFPLRYWSDQKAKCYYRVQTTIEQLKESLNKDYTNISN